MKEFAFFILASVGMSHIMVDGSIFNSFKSWLSMDSDNKFMKLSKWIRTKILELFNCYQCSGLWSGVITGMLFSAAGIEVFSHDMSYLSFAITWFCFGCVTSLLSVTAAVVLTWIQAKSGV